MRVGWEKVALGNVLKKIIGGGTPSKSKDEYWNGNVLWCSVKDMEEDKFHLSDTVDRITELGLKNSSANLIRKGTVVTATRMGLGRAFITDNDMAINQDLKALIPNDKIDNDFLLWTIVVNRSHLENLGTGSTVKGIRLETLRNLKINLPPLKTQRKIASILSAYDDLIENNLKRIKLLEEQAQLTYEEWFVRFKFPGHETIKFNEESGLPEGWEKVKLTEVAKMKFGYAFKASQFNSEGLGKPIIRIRNIPSSSTKDFTTEIVDKKYIVKQGDLLIGMDGEFYVNNWSGPEGYLVQRVCCITSNKEEYKGLITEAIRQPIRVFQASIDGATVAHLGKKHLDQISIIIPKDLNIEFFTYLLNEKINLSNQNQYLKEARDMLLPRLMSGMIDVEKLEVGSFKHEVNDSLGMVAEEKSSYGK